MEGSVVARRGGETTRGVEKEKSKDVRQSNISAAKAVADAVRTQVWDPKEWIK